VTLLAVGKAAAPMASVCLDLLGGHVDAGIVVGPAGGPEPPPPLRWLASAHPVPDERSARAAEAALDLARGVSRDTVLLVLVSGGASSLLALPARGITLEDKRATTARLLAVGADIGALNTVRKHLSGIKGGQLAAATQCDVMAWLLSDVVGDDPGVIGSGPTVGDASTFAEALNVLDRSGGRAVFPPAVVTRLEDGAAGRIAETPKPGAAALARTTSEVIGSARDARDAARDAARHLGYQVVIRESPVIGEAREAAVEHAEWIAEQLSRHTGPTCLISSGETTVTVRGPGRGGRNQELALTLATQWTGAGRELVAACVGTDGVDGPTDAAGARVSRSTIARARLRGLDAKAALQANDSWTFFDALGDLIRTGPTDTNVGDLQVVLAEGGNPSIVTREGGSQ
jgi:hydroxypyruvate reductase